MTKLMPALTLLVALLPTSLVEAQPEKPELVLNDFLVAAPLPAGYVLSRRDLASDGRLVGRMIVVRRGDEWSKIITHIQLADHSQVAARRAAMKGYVNGFSQSLAEAGYRIVDQTLPDIDDDAVFQSPVVIDTVFEDDSGQKLWTRQRILFDQMGFHVQAIGDSPQSFATVSSWADSVHLKGTKPSPTAPPPRPSTRPQGGSQESWINLLTRCDPAKHARHGKASIVDGSLITDSLKAPSQITVASALPDRYEMSAELTRLEGDGPAFIGLVVRGKPCMAVIDGWPDSGTFTGITLIDGKAADKADYPAKAYQGPLLKNAERTTVVCRVDGIQVTILVDGRLVFRWNESPERLSLSKFFHSPGQTASFLGSSRSRYEFHRVTLQPL